MLLHCYVNVVLGQLACNEMGVLQTFISSLQVTGWRPKSLIFSCIGAFSYSFCLSVCVNVMFHCQHSLCLSKGQK